MKKDLQKFLIKEIEYIKTLIIEEKPSERLIGQLTYLERKISESVTIEDLTFCANV